MKKNNFLLSLIIATLYFLFNRYAVQNFDEDAYILYRYVDMFNKGYGITYYPGAQPIEGATDFLWLVMLIGISKLGFDVGTAAILLNSIGVFIVNFILLKLIFRIENITQRIFFASISILWLLFYPLIAALGGFSVLMYCGLFIIPLFLIHDRIHLAYIPLFAISLGLFRPDGVVLGFFLTLITLYLLIKEKRNHVIKLFSLNILIAVGIGFFYYIWRYNYFGNALPLPLYVKQTGGFIVNLKNNISNALLYKHFFIYVFIIMIFCVFYWKIAKSKLILLVPALFLYLFLSISHQSQNIGFRFQATIIISMIFVITAIIVEIINKKTPKSYLIYFVPFLFLIADLKTINELKYRFNKNANNEISIPEFTHEFSKKLLKGNETIALTEAGFFSFFQTKNNKLIDLVGLNTPYTAKNKLNLKYYTALDPDVIYYMRPNKMPPNEFNNKLYKKVETVAEFQNAYDLNEIWNLAKYSKVPLATQQSIIYLSKHWNEYDVYFLRYRKDPYRISEYTFALKKELKNSQNFEKLLDSLKSNSKSLTYYDLIKR